MINLNIDKKYSKEIILLQIESVINGVLLTGENGVIQTNNIIDITESNLKSIKITKTEKQVIIKPQFVSKAALMKLPDDGINLYEISIAEIAIIENRIHNGELIEIEKVENEEYMNMFLMLSELIRLYDNEYCIAATEQNYYLVKRNYLYEKSRKLH